MSSTASRAARATRGSRSSRDKRAAEVASFRPSAGPPSIAPARISALDGLRGIAVLLVLLFHFNEYERDYAVANPDWMLPIVSVFNIGSGVGWIGVHLFFALSGFLITGILHDSRGKPGYFKTFYLRRALRILPLYFAVLLIHLLVLTRMSLPEWANLSYVVSHQEWYWGFFTNFLFVIHGWHRLTSHFWTLAVEEQFYIVWPLVVAVLGGRSLMRFGLILLASSALLRVALFVAGAGPRVSYLLTPTEIDGLVTGSILAVALRRPDALAMLRRYGRAVLMAATCALMALFVWRRGLTFDDPMVPVLGFGAMAIVFAGLTFIGATAPSNTATGRFLGNPVLRFFGRYSYAIYLVHMPIIQLWAAPQRAEAKLVQEGLAPFAAHLLYVVVVTAAILGVAIASWYCIEQPFLRLRPHFTSRPPQLPIADALSRQPRGG